MAGDLTTWRAAGGRGVVLVAAAPAEAKAVSQAAGCAAPERDWQAVPLAPGVELVRSGVGKVNAALAVSRCVDPDRHGLVISLGVAGRYGQDAIRKLLGVVVADASVYADEGIDTGGGFTDIAKAGFPPGGSTEGERAFAGMGVGDRGVADEIAARVSGGGLVVERGVVLTVSTCSGTDALARAYAGRHEGAIAEGMEGAAVGHAAARLLGGRVRFGEVRVLSNTTGNRSEQVWKLAEALEKLSDVARRLIEGKPRRLG
jgi:futalosine hydrolase